MPDQRFRVFRRGTTNRPLILRLTKSEYAELETIADEADIGVATVCKQLLRQALSRGVVVVEEQGRSERIPEEPAEGNPPFGGRGETQP